MSTRDTQKQKIARDYLSVILSLVDIWMDKGSSGAGHVYIGTILTEAFYTTNPWVSPQYIFNRLKVYSIDTIRRRLEEMVDYGVVDVVEIDTKKVYRARPGPAEATIRAYELKLAA